MYYHQWNVLLSYGAYLGSCVANDVQTTIDSVVIDSHDCDTTGDVTLTIQTTYNSGANQRYDLGIFLSEDGGSLQGRPGDSGLALSCVGVAPQVGEGLPDPGFEDLDPTGHSDTPSVIDTCGDLNQNTPVSIGFTATVACVFDTTGENLVIPACRVWQQNANHKVSCEDPGDAGTGSKCDCSPFIVPVPDPCASLDCDDNNVCTTDSCIVENNQAGCVNNPGALDCDDDDVCTTDTCDALDGCVNTPEHLTVTTTMSVRPTPVTHSTVA